MADDDVKYLQGEVVVSSKLPSPRMVIKNLEYDKPDVYNTRKFIGLRVYWWTPADQYFEVILHAKDLNHYDKIST